MFYSRISPVPIFLTTTQTKARVSPETKTIGRRRRESSANRTHTQARDGSYTSNLSVSLIPATKTVSGRWDSGAVIARSLISHKQPSTHITNLR